MNIIKLLFRGNWKKINWLDFVKYIIKGIDLQAKKTAGANKRDSKFSWWAEKDCKKMRKVKILDDYKMTEYLFSNPFYTQERLSKYLKVHRNTASRYFKELEKIGLVKKFKYKNENIYYNQRFLDLLSY